MSVFLAVLVAVVITVGLVVLTFGLSGLLLYGFLKLSPLVERHPRVEKGIPIVVTVVVFAVLVAVVTQTILDTVGG